MQCPVASNHLLNHVRLDSTEFIVPNIQVFETVALLQRPAQLAEVVIIDVIIGEIQSLQFAHKGQISSPVALLHVTVAQTEGGDTASLVQRDE